MSPIHKPVRSAVKSGRIPTLDGWRAVAILAVLCCHIRWPFPVIARFSDYGGLGVQLFFALSGFLITTRILEEYDRVGRVSWRDFYIRRAFRILPPALFALLVLAILGPVLGRIPVTPKQIMACVFFYRNYVIGGGWYTAHFWSLAVEEHFYLLWPAVLLILGVTRGGRAALALTAGAVMWRIADGHYNLVGRIQPLLRGVDHRTDYCLGVLFFGCLLAYAWRSPRLRPLLEKSARSYWVFGVFAAQILLLRFRPKWYESGVELLMGLLPLFTIADPNGFVSRVLETSLLTWIGRLSYSLYLWQQLFLPMSFAPQVLGVLQVLPINVVLAFSAASFSYYAVERPFIKLGRSLQRRALVVPERLTPYSVVLKTSDNL
jgi:peptidoglycan/LPS O-acetylase OafA/YrhL